MTDVFRLTLQLAWCHHSVRPFLHRFHELVYDLYFCRHFPRDFLSSGLLLTHFSAAAGAGMPQLTQQVAGMHIQGPPNPYAPAPPMMHTTPAPAHAPAPAATMPPQPNYSNVQQMQPAGQVGGAAGAAGRARRLDPRTLPNPTKITQPHTKVIYSVAPPSDYMTPPTPPPHAHHRYICTDRGSQAQTIKKKKKKKKQTPKTFCADEFFDFKWTLLSWS